MQPAAATCLAIGSALLASILTGAFALPRGDDWAYRKIALDFSRTHHLHLAGWNDVTLLGQIWLAQPFLLLFGRSNATLSAFGVLAACAAAFLAYRLARDFLSPALSTVVVVTLLVFPSFALQSTSFMTDSSAFVFELLCLILGIRAFQRSRPELFLAASMLAGFVSFTIRELAIAGPAAVLVAHAARRSVPVQWLVAIGAAFCGGVVIFWLWRQSLEPPVNPVSLVAKGSAVSELGQSFFMAALGCLPVTVLFVRRASRRLPTVWIALTALTLVIGLVLLERSHLLLGSTVTRSGADWEGMLVGRQATLISSLPWALLIGTTLVAGGLFVNALGRVMVASSGSKPTLVHGDPRLLLLVLCGVGHVLLLLVRAATGGGILDRYLWPLLVIVLILMLRVLPEVVPRANRVAATFAVALLALLSIVTIVDSYGFAATRWHLGQLAVRNGFDAENVDAGFEWVGTHYRRAASPEGVPQSSNPREAYMFRLFPTAKNCLLVSSEVLTDPGLRLTASRSYNALGVLEKRTLYAYTNRIACPGAAAQ